MATKTAPKHRRQGGHSRAEALEHAERFRQAALGNQNIRKLVPLLAESTEVSKKLNELAEASRQAEQEARESAPAGWGMIDVWAVLDSRRSVRTANELSQHARAQHSQVGSARAALKDQVLEQVRGHLRAGDSMGALRILDELAATCGDAASGYNLEVLRGIALLKAGKLNAAEALLIKARTTCPSDAVPPYYLARVAQERGLPDLARQLISDAASLAYEATYFGPLPGTACDVAEAARRDGLGPLLQVQIGRSTQMTTDRRELRGMLLLD